MQGEQPGITIVGLGTGTWDSLTIEAATLLSRATEVYVRTVSHPSIASLREHVPTVVIHGFDSLYQDLPTFSEVYQRIAHTLVDLVNDSTEVVYGVPGSPSLGETSVGLLIQHMRERALPVRIVQGVSMVEPLLAAVGITDASWLELLDAVEIGLLSSENAVGEVVGEGTRQAWRAPVPTAPMLISSFYDRRSASGVKLWLGKYYPDHHPVEVLAWTDSGTVHAHSMPLYEIDRSSESARSAALYVPPLSETGNVRTFGGLMQLTRTLRAPGGCPWDREQTHASLKPHLLEEAYEVLDALDSEDPSLIVEELGDLLFQITIHSQIAAEAGTFTIEDVIGGVMTKLIGRHPHVFADLELSSAQDVRYAWESFKQREKPKRTSVMEQIPRGLPALPQSNLMQKRAASVGFEWPDVSDVIAKIEEELAELRVEIDSASSKEVQREELGDIFFALVSLARHLRVDPEEALRLANRKFERRFQHVEARATADGKTLRDLSPDALDSYWNEAKLAPNES